MSNTHDTQPVPIPADDDGTATASSPSPRDVELEPLWAVVKRLPTYARLATAMARDTRVPGKAKALLAAGGAYAISPIDLVPGIIPVAGQIDDLYVVLTGLQQAMRICPDDVVTEHFAAHNLAPSIVDEDLAVIRTFVRQGVTWALRNGRKAAIGLTRQISAFASRARQRRGTPNDQEPL